jgi:long-chain acyl-CoA synthetase
MNDSSPPTGKFWLRDYPPDVPAEIDPDSISSLKQLYEDACRQHASQIAFTNMGVTLTYAEVEEKVAPLRRWLQKRRDSKRASALRS